MQSGIIDESHSKLHVPSASTFTMRYLVDITIEVKIRSKTREVIEIKPEHLIKINL